MKKYSLLFIVLLASISFAQTHDLPGYALPKYVSALPANCNPNFRRQSLVYKYTNTVLSPRGIYQCVDTDSWRFANSAGFDATFVGSGINGSALNAFQVGSTSVISNSTNNIYGMQNVFTIDRTGDTQHQTSGVRNYITCKNYGLATGTCTASENFVLNAGSTSGAAYLQSVEGIVQATANFDQAISFEGFSNPSAGKTGNDVWNFRGFFSGNDTVTNTGGLKLIYQGGHVSGVSTDVYGINMSSWTAGAPRNSYAIYIDNSTNIGGTKAYSIFSSSIAPSTFQGDVAIMNNAKGFVLKSPGAVCYRLTVTDAGVLGTAAVACGNY